MKKKRRDATRSTPGGGAVASPRTFGARRPALLLLITVLGTAAIFAVQKMGRGGAAIALPPPSPVAKTAGPAYQDFVGSEACASCHAQQYAAWKGSTHGKAGGTPTRDRVIGPFNGVPMRFKDAVVTPTVTADGQYIFTVAQQSRPPKVFRVEEVVGGGFMAGGGTQAYFGRFPDGTLRFLPFDYSKSMGHWFCNTGVRGSGAVPVSSDLALAECADWTPRRTLGSTERYQGCQQCHGSQIDLRFDTTARRYQTRFTTLAINCESCHGPGRRHIQLAGAGGLADAADIGMRPLATLSKDQSLQVCFQCHAVKAPLRPGYLPGAEPSEHFALKLPMLLDTVYHADGRTRSFAYQEGHLGSDCYLSGSMTCVDCHDPHSQHYRDVDGSPLNGRFDNGQCADCHPSKLQPLERHTHHQAGSTGSVCVSCHMPYVQQPSVGPGIRYARSDHTISIPRPRYDTRLGIENACRQCHRDQTADALETQLKDWYGALKPHHAPVEALLAADSLADIRAAAHRILSVNDADHFAKFAGIAQLFRRYSGLTPGPGSTPPDAATIDRLEQQAGNPDLDVQALALASLHLLGSSDPKVRRFLANQLAGLRGNERPIRERWAWILKTRGDDYLNSGDYRNAVTTYQRANEIEPEDASIHRVLGVAYTKLGEYDPAIEQLRRSLELNPDQPQVLTELGVALMQRGDLEGAITAYRRAVAVSPWDPIGYANLGVALLRRGETQPALEALEKAVSLDPSMADASFVLANAYLTLGRVNLARVALERTLEFNPQNAAARQLLDEVRQRETGPSR